MIRCRRTHRTARQVHRRRHAQRVWRLTLKQARLRPCSRMGEDPWHDSRLMTLRPGSLRASCRALLGSVLARRGSIPPRCSSRQPTAGRPITATTPASGTAAHRDHAGQCAPDDAGLGVPDRADAADQGARRFWSTASSMSPRRTTSGRSTRDRDGSCGATRYPPNEALPHRTAWRRRLQGLRLHHHARRPPGRARRARRDASAGTS